MRKEFFIKDSELGDNIDIYKRPLETLKYNSNLQNIRLQTEEQKNYYVENKKIQEKINTRFFKACEKSEIEKIIEMLDRKTSCDRKANINEKYLHDYTVLHIAITNGNFY